MTKLRHGRITAVAAHFTNNKRRIIVINIRIGNEERKLEDADESWINKQINRRQAAHELVCVRARIEEDGLNLILQTPACSSSGGGGRRPNPHEREVMDLWEKLGLNQNNFTGGKVIAFLKQLMQLA